MNLSTLTTIKRVVNLSIKETQMTEIIKIYGKTHNVIELNVYINEIPYIDGSIILYVTMDGVDKVLQNYELGPNNRYIKIVLDKEYLFKGRYAKLSISISSSGSTLITPPIVIERVGSKSNVIKPEPLKIKFDVESVISEVADRNKIFKILAEGVLTMSSYITMFNQGVYYYDEGMKLLPSNSISTDSANSGEINPVNDTVLSKMGPSKNLFNIDDTAVVTYTLEPKPNYGYIENGIYINTYSLYSSGAFLTLPTDTIKPDTYYTVSCDVISIDEDDPPNNDTIYFRLNTTDNINQSATMNITANTTVRFIKTLKTSVDKEYNQMFGLQGAKQKNYKNTNVRFSNIMLVEGEVAMEYSPYYIPHAVKFKMDYSKLVSSAEMSQINNLSNRTDAIFTAIKNNTLINKHAYPQLEEVPYGIDKSLNRKVWGLKHGVYLFNRTYNDPIYNVDRNTGADYFTKDNFVVGDANAVFIACRRRISEGGSPQYVYVDFPIYLYKEIEYNYINWKQDKPSEIDSIEKKKYEYGDVNGSQILEVFNIGDEYRGKYISKLSMNIKIYYGENNESKIRNINDNEGGIYRKKYKADKYNIRSEFVDYDHKGDNTLPKIPSAKPIFGNDGMFHKWDNNMWPVTYGGTDLLYSPKYDTYEQMMDSELVHVFSDNPKDNTRIFRLI